MRILDEKMAKELAEKIIRRTGVRKIYVIETMIGLGFYIEPSFAGEIAGDLVEELMEYVELEWSDLEKLDKEGKLEVKIGDLIIEFRSETLTQLKVAERMMKAFLNALDRAFKNKKSS